MPEIRPGVLGEVCTVFRSPILYLFILIINKQAILFANTNVS